MITEKEEYYALGNDRSVFQAEMFAIYKAAEWLLTNNTSFRTINIHVDSQAALMALSSNLITKTCVHNTADMLNNLSHKNILTLSWVKSHKGIQGNEKADVLAKNGATSFLVIASDRPHISKKIIKNELKLSS